VKKNKKKKMPSKLCKYINIIFLIHHIHVVICSSPKRDSHTRSANSKHNHYEFFTAATDMEILHKVEKKLSIKFLQYYKEEERRLDRLDVKLRQIEKRIPAQTGFIDDDEDWIGHVTDGYSVLKDFTNFWPNFSNHSKKNSSKASMMSLRKDLIRLKDAYPEQDDLRGALAAIFRLQDTYNLSPAEFVEGMGPYSHKLSPEELFEMGFLCTGIEDYYHARKWLKESYYRFPPNINQVGFLNKASLLEYLAWSEYQLGYLENAIKYTKLVLKLNPTSSAASTNLEFFEQDLEKSKTDPTVRKKIYRDNTRWMNRHNRLCRGDEVMEQSVTDKLFCKISQAKARFILKPLKMEYAYNDPEIIIYHDLLRDHEIDHIKKKARPLLNRATVHHPQTGELMYADYRVSKSAWIFDDMDEIVAKVMKKVGDITNLNMRFAEALQVANYGIAGQYEPHFDHATLKKPKEFAIWGGNRIATMLMYLSDVEKGGRTVFTNTGPGVIIAPQKGSAAFWYNLKKNGQGNPKTEHSACPVLLGQKWVSNLWIHENGQEFLRPCSLNKDE